MRFSNILKPQVWGNEGESWKYSKFDVYGYYYQIYECMIINFACNGVSGVQFSVLLVCFCENPWSPLRTKQGEQKKKLERHSCDYSCIDDCPIAHNKGYSYNELNTLNREYSHLWRSFCRAWQLSRCLSFSQKSFPFSLYGRFLSTWMAGFCDWDGLNQYPNRGCLAVLPFWLGWGYVKSVSETRLNHRVGWYPVGSQTQKIILSPITSLETCSFFQIK